MTEGSATPGSFYSVLLERGEGTEHIDLKQIREIEILDTKLINKHWGQYEVFVRVTLKNGKIIERGKTAFTEATGTTMIGGHYKISVSGIKKISFK